MTDIKLFPISDKVSEDLYTDVAHPLAAEAGKLGGSFGRLVNAVFGKGMDAIAIFAENKWDKLAESYRERLQKIPEERRIEPDFQIVQGILSGYSSAFNKPELERLFENLLVSSADKELAAGILPSFPVILKELSCDEARILKSISSDKPRHFAKFDLFERLSTQDKILLAKNLVHPNIRNVCECPQNIPSYMDNLARLGLIEVSDTLYLTGARGTLSYEEIKESVNVSALVCSISPLKLPDAEPHLEWKQGSFRLTELGRSLSVACGLTSLGIPVYFQD
ncbi:DUF4393 domain-containing protein [Parasutterella excrementihominis]|jgi:hypothetical protein|uniref:DUF4393 domain-containing protein n=1 Tax=Parasutterella excrementihominis TaxID=487175 RepID=UPI0027BAB429|nr:DUF4393 domain-containing protein [Parasutterella excrementihominis]